MSQVAAFLARVRLAVATEHVVISSKAADEATEELGWVQEDILDELCELEAADYLRSEPSIVRAGGVVHTFTPGDLWIRLVERGGIIVVSFHRA